VGVTAAVVTAVAATASAAVAVANYEAAKDAAAAQRDLVNQQQAALKAQQQEQAAEAARMAGTGSQFGFNDESHRVMLTGFGFGTAPSGSPNSGRAQITGMG
jgi:hypothetical protein